jgi:DNA polymerase I-like protein with 3'-5' exonuclease and polymerase domains
VHYSGEENLKEVFVSGLDFYGDIANKVLGIDCPPNEMKKRYPEERFLGKEIGLSVLYGIGAAKLSTMIKKRVCKVIDEQDCKQIIKNYFKAYPKFLEFRKYLEKKINDKEVLQTVYGRQFKIDPKKAFSTGVNSIVQSTASDACLFSQLTIAKKLVELNIDAQLVGLIHDECIYECEPKEAQKVGEIVEQVMTSQPFNCPLKVEWTVAESWGGKK